MMEMITIIIKGFSHFHNTQTEKKHLFPRQKQRLYTAKS